jgi:hypothetical protein
MTVILGDCQTVLRTLPSGMTLVTDPPFTFRSSADVDALLIRLNYKPSDSLILTNPAAGYIYRREFVSLPELAASNTRYHRNARPAETITQLLAKTEGNILDPYCGSGSTLLAAHSLGRASIGIELDRRTFDLCCQHLKSKRDIGV